jgi:hypothetical protein
VSKVKEIYQCDKCKSQFEVLPTQSSPLFNLNIYGTGKIGDKYVDVKGFPASWNGYSSYLEMSICTDCLVKIGIKLEEKESPQKVLSTAEQLYDIIAQIVQENVEVNN